MRSKVVSMAMMLGHTVALRAAVSARRLAPFPRSSARGFLLRSGGSVVRTSLSSSSSTPASASTAPEVVLEFAPLSQAAVKEAPSLIAVGRPDSLKEALASFVDAPLMEAMVGAGKVGDSGKVTNSWAAAAATTAGGDAAPLRHVSLVQLPTVHSRHNIPSRPDAVSALLSSALGAGPKDTDVQVVMVLEDENDRHAVACAAARAFPQFSLKSEGQKEEGREGGDDASPPRVVTVSFVDATGAALDPRAQQSAAAAAAVRRAAALVDTPAEVLNVDRMVQEAEATAERLRTAGGGKVGG